jgi:DNA-directed RNA polymerase subunit RPC12/RpoP
MADDENYDVANPPRRLACPRCGWHDVKRLAKNGLLATLWSTFGFKAFRCRSCGNRFHAYQRATGD